jgi:hypothetical protein
MNGIVVAVWVLNSGIWANNYFLLGRGRNAVQEFNLWLPYSSQAH